MDRWNLVSALLNEEERVNGEYITGNVDRDSWAKTLEIIDERLSIVGLRLSNQPWKVPAQGRGF